MRLQQLPACAFLFVLSGSVTAFAGESNTATKPEAGYTLRYALVHMSPKDGRVIPQEEPSELDKQLTLGSEMTLGPTREALLQKLEAADSRYHFRIVTAGSTRFVGPLSTQGPNALQRFASFRTKPGKLTDYRFAVIDQLEITSDDGAKLQLSRNGASSFALPGVTGTHAGGWRVTHSDFLLGRTYHGGIDGFPNGDRLAYLLMIVRGNSPFEK